MDQCCNCLILVVSYYHEECTSNEGGDNFYRDSCQLYSLYMFDVASMSSNALEAKFCF